MIGHYDQEYVLVDVETTGLALDEFLLEVAAITVDKNLREVGRFHSLVTEAASFETVLQAMHWKAREMHEKSGLLEELRLEYERPDRCTTPFNVECALLRFFEETRAAPGRIKLVGYSPHFDQRHIMRTLPLVGWACSYQVIDIGSVRRAYNLAGHELKKRESEVPHRAMADAESALYELRDLVRVAARALPFFRASERPASE